MARNALCLCRKHRRSRMEHPKTLRGLSPYAFLLILVYLPFTTSYDTSSFAPRFGIRVLSSTAFNNSHASTSRVRCLDGTPPLYAFTVYSEEQDTTRLRLVVGGGPDGEALPPVPLSTAIDDLHAWPSSATLFSARPEGLMAPSILFGGGDVFRLWLPDCFGDGFVGESAPFRGRAAFDAFLRDISSSFLLSSPFPPTSTVKAPRFVPDDVKAVELVAQEGAVLGVHGMIAGLKAVFPQASITLALTGPILPLLHSQKTKVGVRATPFGDLLRRSIVRWGARRDVVCPASKRGNGEKRPPNDIDSAFFCLENATAFVTDLPLVAAVLPALSLFGAAGGRTLVGESERAKVEETRQQVLSLGQLLVHRAASGNRRIIVVPNCLPPLLMTDSHMFLTVNGSTLPFLVSGVLAKPPGKSEVVADDCSPLDCRRTCVGIRTKREGLTSWVMLLFFTVAVFLWWRTARKTLEHKRRKKMERR